MNNQSLYFTDVILIPMSYVLIPMFYVLIPMSCVLIPMFPCPRLFGIVNRTIDHEKEKSKFICHVLEAQNGMAVSMYMYSNRHCFGGFYMI